MSHALAQLLGTYGSQALTVPSGCITPPGFNPAGCIPPPGYAAAGAPGASEGYQCRVSQNGIVCGPDSAAEHQAHEAAEGRAARWFWGTLSMASLAVCTYHGMKRNNGSLGWGLGWGLFGAAFPVVGPTLALAQGFAQPLPLNAAGANG